VKVQQYKDSLGYKDQEIEKRDGVIRRLGEDKEEAEKRVKRMQLKMRQ
jgi:hypothetical protein